MNKIYSLLFILVLSSISQVRATTPDWYQELGNIDGVNVPRLNPGRNLQQFFNHPSFERNMTAMQWNTFRLPIEWDLFLKPQDFEKGIEQVEALISVLKRISQVNNHRVLLILDFHQFKYGKQCGGVGIPPIVDGQSLDIKDPNCLFRAFKLFWENNNGVQDKWIEFSLKVLERLEPLILAQQSWLTLGIEPMNEPFFGTNGDFLPKNNSSVKDLLKVFNFLSKDLLKKSINEDLFPFHHKFVSRLEKRVTKTFMQNSLFILDPILLDHLGAFMGPVPVFLKGDYAIFKKLKISPNGAELTWLAAPHQYGGSYDPAFFDLFPQLIVPMLKNYPNPAFNRLSIDYRIELQRKTFEKAGMETIIGEWGTYLTLKNAIGKEGGAKTYVGDVLRGVKKSLKGHLWWIYDFNNGAHAQSYYLLNGKGESLEEQTFKCDILQTVYKKCPL